MAAADGANAPATAAIVPSQHDSRPVAPPNRRIAYALVRFGLKRPDEARGPNLATLARAAR